LTTERAKDLIANKMSVNQLEVRGGIVSVAGSVSSGSTSQAETVLQLRTIPNLVLGSEALTNYAVGLGPLGAVGGSMVFFQSVSSAGSAASLQNNGKGYITVAIAVPGFPASTLTRYIALFDATA